MHTQHLTYCIGVACLNPNVTSATVQLTIFGARNGVSFIIPKDLPLGQQGVLEMLGPWRRTTWTKCLEAFFKPQNR